MEPEVLPVTEPLVDRLAPRGGLKRGGTKTPPTRFSQRDREKARRQPAPAEALPRRDEVDPQVVLVIRGDEGARGLPADPSAVATERHALGRARDRRGESIAAG